MSKDKDMVAVMLPRRLVNYKANCPMRVIASEEEIESACKRALRPEPPSWETRCDLNDYQRNKDGKKAADWIEHVIEHGWEVES